MKILHIITGLNPGGAENVMLRLILSLPEHKHTVISLKKGGELKHKLSFHGINVFELSLYPFGFLRSIIRLRTVLKKTNPDIIQSWMYHADLVGSCIALFYNRYPVYWNIRNSSLDDAKMSTKILIKMLSICSKHLPKKIISCSMAAEKIHISLGYDPKKFVNIPNGISTNLTLSGIPDKIDYREHLGISDKIFLIGCVARYHPQKDHLTLIKAFANVLKNNSKCVLLLVGRGIHKANAIRKISDQLKIREKVFFLDHVEDPSAIYRCLDLKVLSSSSGEGFPNVLIEAMAHEVPCISSNIGDSEAILKNPNYIFQAGNIDELSNKIEKVIDMRRRNSRKLFKMTKKNKFRVDEKYSLEKMAKKYVQCWDNN